MSENEAIWYLAEENGDPRGPYGASQVLESLQENQVSEQTLCWREGMVDWRPLGQTVPFSVELRKAKAAATRRAMRIPTFLFLLACLGAAGVLVYVFVAGSREIRRAEKLIADGHYAEASRALSAYAKKHNHSDRAIYLLAVAGLNEYAISGDSVLSMEALGIDRRQDPSGRTDKSFAESMYERPRIVIGEPVDWQGPLREIVKYFRDAFASDPKWVEKAKVDTLEAAQRVPRMPPDDYLTKSLAIARLQADLKLETDTELAVRLFKRLKESASVAPQPAVPDDLLPQILKWDLSLVDQVFSTVVGARDLSHAEFTLSLRALQNIARQVPASARRLSERLIRFSGACAGQGDYDRAEQVLSVAEQMAPQCASEAAQARAAYLRQMLSKGLGSRVVAVLDRKGRSSPEMSSLAGELYVAAARSIVDNNPSGANDALDKAVRCAPDILQGQDNEWLYIQVAPPSGVKLDKCKRFLDSYSDSTHRMDVWLTIIRDATTSRVGMWGAYDVDVTAYRREGLAAAKTLLNEYPQRPELHEVIIAFAKKLERDGQRSDALNLAAALLAADPDEAIKARTEQFRDRLQALADSEGRTRPDLAPSSGLRRDRPTGPNLPNRIDIVDDLKQALLSDPRPKLLWVALPKESVDEDTFRQLSEWVKAGNVLWVETDLAERLGFPSLRRSRSVSTSGFAQATPEPHPVVTGATAGQIVRYELGPGSLVLEGDLTRIKQSGITPLLHVPRSGRGNAVTAVCAIRDCLPDGYVVFRPSKIVQERVLLGRSFELSLLEFSLKPHKVAQPRRMRPQRRIPSRR